MLAALVIAGLAWIRLAPSDPAVWHLDPAAPGFVPPANAAAFCPGPESRYGSTGADLAPLIAVAESWPRTRRLAGSVEEGRITYITRSRLLGFPDYTTIALREVGGMSQICMVARQRFGLRDFGVNAARIHAWVEAAYGLNLSDAPDRIWD